MTTYSVLRKALVSEFAEIVKSIDVYRRMASRKKKKKESAKEFIYSLQKLAQAIEIRTMLYEATTIAELKKEKAWRGVYG